MKTTRINIEGPMGRASVRRDGRDIIITGTRVTKVVERRDGHGVPVGEAFRLVGRADLHGNNVLAAEQLQRYLDGCRGTGTDVAAYLRVLMAFED